MTSHKHEDDLKPSLLDAIWLMLLLAVCVIIAAVFLFLGAA